MNLLLNWESSSCATPLSQRVEYKKRSDSNWTTHSSVPCGVNSIYVNDLEDDILYEFRVGSLCSDGTSLSIIYSAYTIIIKINCVTFDLLDPAQASIDYTFTGKIDYESYDVVLLSEADVELERQNKVYTVPITGTFSGLSPKTNYKLRIEPIAFFEKFKRVDCPAEIFTTEDIGIPDCADALFDIIFVNDESGSIGSINFKTYIIPGITNIVRTVSQLIVDQQIRVGLKGFSSGRTNRLDLSDDYNVVLNTIKTSPYSAGMTYTVGGLQLALDELTADTRNVPSKVILVTDGDPNRCAGPGDNSISCGVSSANLAKLQSEAAADSIKALIKGGQNVELITVGVETTAVNNNWLRDNIATDVSKHFTATNFNDFLAIADQIALTICINMPDPVPDGCEACRDVVATIQDQPNTTCIPPGNVYASLLTLPVLCGTPTRVSAIMRPSCGTPAIVIGIIL